MRCVFRSFDHTQAEIVADLLRAEGCPAHVFENGLSRLQWTYVIAFGGARVTVSDERQVDAVKIVERWEQGEYSLDTDDDLRCPRCTSRDVEQDPRYRGWAFFFGCLIGFPLFPRMKWRERCRSCKHHWRALPPHAYAELAAGGRNTEAPDHDQ